MDFSTILLISYLAATFGLIYLCVLAPVLHNADSWPVRAHYFVTGSGLRQFSYKAVQTIFGFRIANCCSNAYSYAFVGRNPLLIVFYTTLYFGCVSLFIYEVYIPLLLNHPDYYQFSDLHVISIPFCIIYVFLFYVKACTMSPGFVNRDNIDQILQHEQLGYFDDILFHQYPSVGKCRTCQLIKPARSKHCSLCGGCVMVYDHHCVWLNQCVGYYNRRWFMGFLFTLIGICIYGIYLMSSITYWMLYVSYQGEGKGIINRSYQDIQGTQQIDLFLGILIILSRHVILIALNLFASIITIMIGLFLIYHLYLIASGQTTNEVGKWEDVKYEIEQKYKDDKEACKKELQLLYNQGGYSKGILNNFMEVLFPDYSVYQNTPELIRMKQE